jgi:hypothetical protein
MGLGIIKSKGASGVEQEMRQLTRDVHVVFDYFRMTNDKNITELLWPCP